MFEDLCLPLQLCGIISYLPTQAPDENDMYKHIHHHITPPTSTWDPHNESYADQETIMVNYQGEIFDIQLNPNQNNTIAASTIVNDDYAQLQICSVLQSISNLLNVNTFAYSLLKTKYSIKSINSGK